MTWSLVREIGIEYAFSDGSRDDRLVSPSFVERAPDGSYLIVDEVGVHKAVPFQFECRTIRVHPNGDILYDTMAEGIRDGCGCLLEDGSTAVLRRTGWEVLIVAPDGAILDRIGLSHCSKRMPRFLSVTPRQTFLGVFLDRSGVLDLVELDRSGRILWYLPSTPSTLKVPKSVQLLQNGNILVADEFRHVVVELDRTGTIVWKFGEAGDPAARPGRLSNPRSARLLADGRRVIADTRNHRILAIDTDGEPHVLLAGTHFCDPSFADVLPSGHHLICDTGNGRVAELDEAGDVVWQYGRSIARARAFSYPRSVELTEEGKYLIADSAHNRIVSVENGTLRTWHITDRSELFWPRCARALPDGAILVADSRNHRIVEVSGRGEIVNELGGIELGDRQPFGDPHDVRPTQAGHLLVTDSTRDWIVEVDWAGRVHRLIGEDGNVELADPHSAQQLPDGRVLISDTGHHRLLVVNEAGKCVQEIEALRHGTAWLRLHQPRYAEVSPDGILVIADTGHNRILAATPGGELVWELARVPGSPLTGLHQPRWAHLTHQDEVIVCDHFHHRILHLERRASGT